MRLFFDNLDSGNKNKPATTAIIANGTLIKNAECHENCSSKAPPIIGPKTAPIDEAIDHTANAVALSLGFSKITLIIERVVGIIKAPAIPSKNRIAITNSALSAKNIANETRPNKANPVNNAFSSPFISKGTQWNYKAS